MTNHIYMGIIDTVLYNSYHPDDLRKPVFFMDYAGFNVFKGCYSDAPWYPFNGLATDEVLLTRAECRARKGDASGAMADLNMLLQKRWRNTVTYTSLTATDAEDALRKILTERRKELCFRGIRWTDLRRLNKDPRFAITLKRVVGSHEYTLPPDDKRYVYPIPNDEIVFSGVEQNPR